MADITVVIMTRDRVDELLGALEHVSALPEKPPIVVVDNGSTDGSAPRVREAFPDVEVIRLDDNLGVEARNIAVRRARTPYIAFNDDDSWWSPGALTRVVELFRGHPRLAAVTAHITVEPSGRDDPIAREMAESPVEGSADLPGVPVLGFLACATAVRRSAYLAVGGFSSRLHFGGEEELFCADLAAAGWEVRYVPELRVTHQPSTSRDHPWRQRRGLRNALWFQWLRRPAGHAVRRSARLLRGARPAAAGGALLQAAWGLPWVLRERRVVPSSVETQLRRLEADQDRSTARQYKT